MNAHNLQPASGPVRVHPSVSDTFGHGWDTMKKNLPELLLILLIQMVFSLPMGLVNAFRDQDSFSYATFSLFNIVYGLVIMAPVSFGSSYLFFLAVKGEPFRVTDIFNAFRQTLQIILASILMGLIIGTGIILLIVPGIIFACKLSLVPYLMMDRNMEPAEAVRTSWQMTRGHSWTIFAMGLVSVFVALGGLILLVVGIFPAVIWISLAFASMYHAICQAGSTDKSPGN